MRRSAPPVGKQSGRRREHLHARRLKRCVAPRHLTWPPDRRLHSKSSQGKASRIKSRQTKSSHLTWPPDRRLHSNCSPHVAFRTASAITTDSATCWPVGLVLAPALGGSLSGKATVHTCGEGTRGAVVSTCMPDGLLPASSQGDCPHLRGEHSHSHSHSHSLSTPPRRAHPTARRPWHAHVHRAGLQRREIWAGDQCGCVSVSCHPRYLCSSVLKAGDQGGRSVWMSSELQQCSPAKAEIEPSVAWLGSAASMIINSWAAFAAMAC